MFHHQVPVKFITAKIKLLFNKLIQQIMSRKFTLVLVASFLAFVSLSSSGCGYIDGVDGNGKVVKETRSVSGFDRFDAGGAFNIFLTQGSIESLIIEADENLIPLIITEVRGGKLYIETKENIRHSKTLNLYLTFKELKKMDISGACEITSADNLTFENLEIEGSGASEIDLKLTAVKLSCDFSGASEIDLAGSADECSMDMSGASELDAFGFVVKNYEIDLSGAGEANIHVTGSLKAEVSGAASIRYEGNPKVDSRISGAGSVKAR